MSLLREVDEIRWMMLESSKKFKGLYLTFPKQGWETIGAKLMKLFGVVSGVFSSSDEAISKIRKLKSKTSDVLDEFVVGSHGGGQELFMSKKGEQPSSLVSILEEAKPLIGPQTKVFFTACFGADYLKRLTDASRQLGGVGVYGSAGIYNYITNESQKGFYYCKTTANVEDEFTKQKNSKPGTMSKVNQKTSEVSREDFNKFALEKGYCQKVDTPPINWVKNFVK